MVPAGCGRGGCRGGQRGGGGVATLCVGDYEFEPSGVELAVRVMRQGEVALLKMHARFDSRARQKEYAEQQKKKAGQQGAAGSG